MVTLDLHGLHDFFNYLSMRLPGVAVPANFSTIFRLFVHLLNPVLGLINFPTHNSFHLSSTEWHALQVALAANLDGGQPFKAGEPGLDRAGLHDHAPMSEDARRPYPVLARRWPAEPARSLSRFARKPLPGNGRGL